MLLAGSTHTKPTAGLGNVHRSHGMGQAPMFMVRPCSVTAVIRHQALLLWVELLKNKLAAAKAWDQAYGKEWGDGLDGLYWNFIERNADEFSKTMHAAPSWSLDVCA